jgi:alkanesulfonate monooxygenase SsuD/methylene tetrahydromethanopterin reductase-like flavin-dependent oxidoreductase (luciferase family)/ABC-type proline/glycine betaine transport system permease subunit
VVRKLWDSFEDDAFLRDRESGVFFDPGRLHHTGHEGEHFKVKGPLNVPRSPQGHPVIVQAGQSDDGRGLAAATAEVIFTAHQRLDTAQEFYRDIKARARGMGRDPDHVLVMPGVSPFVGRTEAEARAKYERLTGLILEQDGSRLLNALTGGTLDLKGCDLDGPLPPAPPTEGMKSRQALIRQIADENGFTIRQLYQWVASARGHFTLSARSDPVADTLQEWFENEAADGFNILPPLAAQPAQLTSWDLVIPELQRRGLFRTAYEAARCVRPGLCPIRQPTRGRPRRGAGGGSDRIMSVKGINPPLIARASQSPRSAARPGRRPRCGRRRRGYGLVLILLALGRWRAPKIGSAPRCSPPGRRHHGGALARHVERALLTTSQQPAARRPRLRRGRGARRAARAVHGPDRGVERVLDPMLQFFRQTSALALYPVFILLLGLGETSKVFVIFWATLFPILLSTIGGVKEVDRKLIEMAATFGAPRLTIFRRVVLPASVPSIFVGLRLSATTALLLLIAAEMIGANKGLGFQVMNAQYNFQIPLMFAAILLLALLGLAANGALVALQRRLCRWADPAR